MPHRPASSPFENCAAAHLAALEMTNPSSGVLSDKRLVFGDGSLETCNLAQLQIFPFSPRRGLSAKLLATGYEQFQIGSCFRDRSMVHLQYRFFDVPTHSSVPRSTLKMWEWCGRRAIRVKDAEFTIGA